MYDLSHFARIVRPARTLSFEEALASPVTDEPILLHGNNVDAFSKAIPRVGWGSAAVLDGQACTNGKDDEAELAARRNSFSPWYKGSALPGFTSNLRTWVKQDENSGYGSHREVLEMVVRRTTGPVLELGSGDGSTPLLHNIAEEHGRCLVTVDSNADWLDRYLHFQSSLHTLLYAKDPAETDQLDVQGWSVVFVDHAPGESRRRAIDRARRVCEFIVVHDTEELGYELEPLLNSFSYRRDHRKSRPWTTVVSDVSTI